MVLRTATVPPRRCRVAPALRAKALRAFVRGWTHVKCVHPIVLTLDEEAWPKLFPASHEAGWREVPGRCGFKACADHPSATLSRRALLDEEGRAKTAPRLSRGGVARSAGVRPAGAHILEVQVLYSLGKEKS